MSFCFQTNTFSDRANQRELWSNHMIKVKYVFIVITILLLNTPSPAQQLNPSMSNQLQSLPENIRSQIIEYNKKKEKLQNMKSATEKPDDRKSEPEIKDQEPEIKIDAPKKSKDADQLSKIEIRYRTGYNSSLSTDLRQYGYTVFESASLHPSKLAVPDESYIIGPGDKLLIRIWGSDIDSEYEGTVSRDGTINVPRIGIVPVAGNILGNIETIIRKEAEKYIQGINVNVSIRELRSVEIYVVGSVNNPGLHLVPAFSTSFSGLLAGGGVKKSGSLRNIELYRNGAVFREIDLYDLLLKGSRDFDAILEDRDVIFVPRIKKTAAVAGAVNEEAIFEIKDENTVGDLMQLAGSILPQGFMGRIHLRRFRDNQEFTIKDIDTQTAAVTWRTVEIMDGDLLEFQFVDADRADEVRLDGHVWMPDVFQYKDGMKMSDILDSKTILKPGAMMDFAYLYRYDQETTQTMTKQFPLADVFSGEYDLSLAPRDRIIIISRDELGIKRDITISGAVWNPGPYPFSPNTALEDIIALAGGIKFGANTDKIEVTRKVIKNSELENTYFLLSLNKDNDFMLQPYDYIFLPLLKNATTINKVSITGEIKYPGTYAIRENERISDLIQRAGGFTDYAYFYGVKYASEAAQQIQQKSIDNLIQQMEISAHRAISQQAQTAASEEAIEGTTEAGMALSQLLDKLKQIKAEGRITIKMDALEKFKDTKYDFVLENGDALYIPKKPNFVNVVGSVYSPNAYLFEDDMTIGYYLGKSGGPSKTADDDYIYLLKANGDVLSRVQTSGFFSDSFEDIPVMPGDTIVVPEDLERIPYLRLVKDISDIVFKIATTAGVVVAIQ